MLIVCQKCKSRFEFAVGTPRPYVCPYCGARYEFGAHTPIDHYQRLCDYLDALHERLSHDLPSLPPLPNWRD